MIFKEKSVGQKLYAVNKEKGGNRDKYDYRLCQYIIIQYTTILYKTL